MICAVRHHENKLYYGRDERKENIFKCEEKCVEKDFSVFHGMSNKIIVQQQKVENGSCTCTFAEDNLIA